MHQPCATLAARKALSMKSANSSEHFRAIFFSLFPSYLSSSAKLENRLNPKTVCICVIDSTGLPVPRRLPHELPTAPFEVLTTRKLRAHRKAKVGSQCRWRFVKQPLVTRGFSRHDRRIVLIIRIVIMVTSPQKSFYFLLQ